MILSGVGRGRLQRCVCRTGLLFVLGSFAVVGLSAPPALAAPSPPGPSALMPSPATLDFSSQDIHKPSNAQVNFTNTSANPTTVSPATITGPDASSYSISQDTCSNQTIQPNNGCFIQVTFSALTTGPGAKSATLTLNDDNGTNTGTNQIALSGTAVTGTLSADQHALSFGGLVIDQGNSDQQHVTISDDLSASVNLSNVQVTGADASSFFIQNNGCPTTLQPGNTCQIYVQFQPNSAGAQVAQLQIDNDGTADPLVVSLTGEGLTGPAVTISPPQAIYGNVTLGSQSSRTFTLSNDGDAPLQIGAMFLAAGSPQVFPLSDNNCLQRQIAAGHSCRFRVGFIPIAPGDKDGSLFVISNASNPGVTTIGLDGTGVAPPGPPAAAPNGTATISGPARAGKRLTCLPHSYPSDTAFAYQWLRNGTPIPGAHGRRRLLGDPDVGARLACRLSATSPGGSQTVTSTGTPRVLAQLAIGTTSVTGTTITATVTLSRGRLRATARTAGPAGRFATRTVTVRTGGTYTIALPAGHTARRALQAGRTLHVTERLVLTAPHAGKPVRRSFSVTIHRPPTRS
jgi:hypothetical protein